MRYPAYLEVGPNGATLGFVFILPGLSVRARSPEAALLALPAAVAAERARLAAAGRALPGPATADDPVIEIADTERVAAKADPTSGPSTALFRYELRATRDEDVALALDRVALAHQEIGQVVAVAGSAGDPRLGAALLALAEGEWWLLSRLGNRPAVPLPPESDPWARCEAVRAAVAERLTHLMPGDHERHAVFAGEPWTARKLLRRLACLARDAAAGVEALRAVVG